VDRTRPKIANVWTSVLQLDDKTANEQSSEKFALPVFVALLVVVAVVPSTSTSVVDVVVPSDRQISVSKTSTKIPGYRQQ
jgi:uncharacterized membrane protein YadS